MDKENKKEAHPIIWIVIGIVIAAVVFYMLGYSNKSNNKQQNSQQSASGTSNQLSNQPSQSTNQSQQNKNNSSTQTAQPKTKAEIIAKWAPKIAYVYCEWDYTNGTFALAKQGSGTLARSQDGTYGVFTNKHVAFDSNTNTSPNFCKIYFPNDSNITTVYDINQIQYDPKGNDAAIIVIKNPDSYIIANTPSDRDLTSNLKSLGCYMDYQQDIVLGQDIIFLGYPDVGSPSSQLTLKASQGIISGFDGDYYLTDAKIEEGNSGGAAILMKDDCMLGITTYKTYGPTYEYYSGVLDLGAVLTAR